MMEYTPELEELKNETFREYVMLDGTVYRIDAPTGFHISSPGAHYVMDTQGVCHTIQRDKFSVLRFGGGLGFSGPSGDAS